MKNDKKLKHLRVLIDRINRNLKDIEHLHMASLSPLWAELEKKALAIYEDLRILLPLAAEVQPPMIELINTLREAVVAMRIDSYNRLNDVTASIAAGEPVHQEPTVCEAMLAHGISDPTSQRAIDYCTSECPYQLRCLATEPAKGTIS